MKPTVLLSISGYLLCTCTASGVDVSEERLARLEQQFSEVLDLAKIQQDRIASLENELAEMRRTADERQSELTELRTDVEDSLTPLPPTSSGESPIVMSGEVGIEFFSGERNAQFPNDEFMVGEARVFLDAIVAPNIYFSSTVELFRRESDNSDVEVGEAFVDLEHFLRLDDFDGIGTLRVGRFQIPFGHEYLNRYVFGNPLVSHSVADVMGIDEGIELFGEAGPWGYTLAAMNGGKSSLRDFDAEKALVGRLEYKKGDRFLFGASFMNTGSISVSEDGETELWFGDTRFRSIGSTGTNEFDVGIGQLDLVYNWKGGGVKFAVGEARYRDDDPAGNNERDFSFYQLEWVQHFTSEVYGALRFSNVDVNGGYPLAGNGNPNYFIESGLLTESLSRFSIGLGYNPFGNVVTKIEYSKENGTPREGEEDRDTDQLSAELGVRF